MRVRIKKRWIWLAGLVLLLAIPLTFLLSRVLGRFLRDVVAVPILYVVWIVRVYLRTIPNALFWGALLVIGLALAVLNLRTVLTRRGEDTGEEARRGSADRRYLGRLQRLASQIRLVDRSAYFRVRLAQRLGALLLQAMGYGERYRPEQVERGLDVLGGPPDVRAFLRQGGYPMSPPRRTGFLAWLRRRWLTGKQTDGHRLVLEQVVRFLEERLEAL